MSALHSGAAAKHSGTVSVTMSLAGVGSGNVGVVSRRGDGSGGALHADGSGGVMAPLYLTAGCTRVACTCCTAPSGEWPTGRRITMCPRSACGDSGASGDGGAGGEGDLGGATADGADRATYSS
ncbi:hypothetical protein NP493_50g03019 [Ridgeia piscesae]|uniref:Uncharacterized protein n=1 Tax=Ridgeia piscesae TaxID=27915 RepID=A0AAD9UJG5_RIDPI|nr:hypothetical protein NP493_50g03019 [Ridgeia piscesae]